MKRSVIAFAGLVCIAIVVIARIAEHFLIPAVSRGAANAVGHYLDLGATGLGGVLIVLALFLHK